MLEFRVLGSLDLRGAKGEDPSSLVSQPKRLALLAYLILASPHGFHRRDTLLALFWPDSTDERARHSLNQALHVLRQELGSDVVETRGGEEVGLNRAELWCDALALEEMLDEGRPADGLTLYRGELLGGFHLGGCPEFDRWLEGERFRLRTYAVAAALALASALGSRGQEADAILWARRALEWAPYDEKALRELLTHLDRNGDRAGAIQEYETFATRLEADLEVAASPETKAIVEAIRDRETVNERPSRPSVPAEVQERGGRASPQPPRVPRASGSRRRPVLLFVAAAVAVGAVAATVLSQGRDNERSLRDERLVVAPFENRTGDPSLDAVGSLAAEWIAQGLMYTGLMEVVSPTDALRTGQVLAREKGDLAVAELAWALADETGARILVSGCFNGSSEGIVFDAQVTDVATGELLRGVEGVGGSLERVGETVEVLRQRVLGALATLLDERLASWSDVASQPPSFHAYQLYSDGLDLFLQHGTGLNRDSLYAKAGNRFLEANAVDSTFTAPLVWAVFAFFNAWRPADAEAVRDRLANMRDRLPPWDRAMTDFLLAYGVKDWLVAVRAARRVAELAPDSDWLYKLGQAALRANRPQEAVDALERIDPTKGWMKEWPSYWTVLLSARHHLGDCEGELEDSYRARRQHGGRRWLGTARALACLGRGWEALEVAEEAWAQAEKSGSVHSQLNQLYEELMGHGETKAADSLNIQIRAWYRSLPEAERQGVSARYYYAVAWMNAGRPDSARAIYRSMLRDPVPDTYRDYITCDLGVLAGREGDRDEAERLAAVDMGGGYFELCPPMIAAELGDRERAVALLRGAISRGVHWQAHWHAFPSFQSLRGHPAFEELIRPKG
ncbi:BTAD domain-containing putative transcriptional regulator [Gemmatimonadota bacterium]